MNAHPRPSGRSSVLPVLVIVGMVLLAVMCTVGGDGPGRIVLPWAMVGAALAAAAWAVRRARADRAAYESRLTAWAASEAVLAERLRIAGDLHDIVSHGLGLITVRAAATRHLPKPAEVEAALTDIEDASRHATAELRRMLTVLREPSAAGLRAPLDGLDDLPAIVDSAAVAGLRTRLTVDPELGAVSQGVQVAVCKTVREGLSNAARYAGPTDVRVAVHRDGRFVVAAVTDAGPSDPAWRATPGAGHGLVGLRERVTSLDGTLTAEPVGGGFRVAARIPDDAA
ncbi:sensor histidine kinase [Dactylosporangium sp. CA-152071]|uniref:sensor histidine kinase n=1 Tax=Dactylosporangium sp. CA-152071 TaxID=3239933 RepID=UPI003D8C79E8